MQILNREEIAHITGGKHKEEYSKNEWVWQEGKDGVVWSMNLKDWPLDWMRWRVKCTANPSQCQLAKTDK